MMKMVVRWVDEKILMQTKTKKTAEYKNQKVHTKICAMIQQHNRETEENDLVS